MCCGVYFALQRPGNFGAMADLLIRSHKRYRALSLELAADQSMQRLLVALLLRRSLRFDR